MASNLFRLLIRVCENKFEATTLKKYYRNVPLGAPYFANLNFKDFILGKEVVVPSDSKKLVTDSLPVADVSC